MKKEQLTFLLLAFVTTFSIVGVGISISLGSILVFSLSILAATICCGVGFSLRKKLASDK
ncbi:DUF5325 family protein [Anaerobacillus isosaccharinicus]|uniref:DUF5325 family protein n=1 Tax=Anaerobacillus isosaccharinicus TaxID=1532552 RepID=A0A1S2M7G0_9BACI|nr:DUF5325 family protein [Anaerobacillus isosaccharinicus]MBA5587495.1 DUF5325 family protein [Anaerobacillus isosaccharinicus]QOY34323.1 DUF5325 family protein [Anaerobacillus isosaccharinicus]